MNDQGNNQTAALGSEDRETGLFDFLLVLAKHKKVICGLPAAPEFPLLRQSNLTLEKPPKTEISSGWILAFHN